MGFRGGGVEGRENEVTMMVGLLQQIKDILSETLIQQNARISNIESRLPELEKLRELLDYQRLFLYRNIP